MSQIGRPPQRPRPSGPGAEGRAAWTPAQRRARPGCRSASRGRPRPPPAHRRLPAPRRPAARRFSRAAKESWPTRYEGCPPFDGVSFRQAKTRAVSGAASLTASPTGGPRVPRRRCSCPDPSGAAGRPRPSDPRGGQGVNGRPAAREGVGRPPPCRRSGGDARSHNSRPRTSPDHDLPVKQIVTLRWAPVPGPRADRRPPLGAGPWPGLRSTDSVSSAIRTYRVG